MENISNPQLLTAQEVSRLLRIKSATLYQAAADGRIPCVRLWQGKKKALIRFHREDIEQLIQGKSNDSTKAPSASEEIRRGGR